MKTKLPTFPEPHIRAAMLAAYWDMAPRKIKDLVKSGELAGMRVNQVVYVRISSANEFAKARAMAA